MLSPLYFAFSFSKSQFSNQSVMSVSIKSGALLSGSSAKNSFDLAQQLGISPTSSSIKFTKPQSVRQSLVLPEGVWSPKSPKTVSVNASYRGMRWREKRVNGNMVEMKSAQDLVDTLNNAGDRLVVVDFYSPGCGGCRALHPKICQLAESNPDAIFLEVNHQELKKMCEALHIHVLPFFRFYRGSKGRLCSFSCTLSTISKFKYALAKCSSGELQSGVGNQAKGLDEAEIRSLVEIGEISISAVPETRFPSQEMENLFMEIIKSPNLPSIAEELLEAEGNSLSVA